jgi:hypothetical protein
MRGLHLLIELARRTTDERRGDLGQASQACASTYAEIVAHEDAFEREVSLGVSEPAILVASGAWSRHAARTRTILTERHIEQSQREQAARDALRSAFLDQKRLEKVHETVDQGERLSARKRAESRAADLHTSMRDLPPG